MNKKFLRKILLSILIISCSYITASAETLAPDRSSQVLDLLALECQYINDFSFMAQYGDLSNFDEVKRHVSVAINNITILMNGYDNESINKLWNMYNELNPDAESAKKAFDICSSVRGDIYRKISNDERMNRSNGVLNNFNDCENAGYHVNGGTCFIGGTAVFDNDGNLIGFYYSDCFDSEGFHPGSCWDCFYGADNEGCKEKP
ncbi:MAG: hypothetical protein IJI14_18280 [Anaerolineaceae bacterium]|nr:hypothetical protein [Anaerolineaceae bacterium]